MRSYFQSKACVVAGCLLVFFVGLSFLLQGCTKNIAAETSAADESVKVHRVAVFPIHRLEAEDAADRVLRSPIGDTIVTAGVMEPDAQKVVEDVLLKMLDQNKKLEIVPPERVQGVFQRISSESLKTPRREALVKTGRELDVDAVLYGYVYRFRERKGYAYGTDQAASVAFELNLISARDGSILWKGTFDKTQKSLMENLLQFFAFKKEGWRWVTARELTEEGVAELLKTIPGGQ